MKKKFLSAILMFTICTTFTACSSSEESDSKKSSTLTKAEVQQMIDDNNESLKEELLSEITPIIESKLKNVKISTAEKEELRRAIVTSLESTIDKNNGSTIVQKEPDQYITNVTEEYITNVTEETPDDSNNNAALPTSPAIEDGLEIPISFELPYNYVWEDKLTFTIEAATFQAYNHKNEPYREIPYPYEIRYNVSGSIINHTPDVSYGMSGISLFTFEPYGTEMLGPNMNIDYDNNTFTYTGTVTVNIVPDNIGINE